MMRLMGMIVPSAFDTVLAATRFRAGGEQGFRLIPDQLADLSIRATFSVQPICSRTGCPGTMFG